MALSWCLDFSEVVYCAQEMETKLNQRQTENNCVKNQEHFSLEPIKRLGDEQHMLYQTNSACVSYVSKIIIEPEQ